jgi:hypothetical protein
MTREPPLSGKTIKVKPRVSPRKLRHGAPTPLTRVNSTNVLDEGLRIGEIGRRMNSKVRLVEIGVYQK